MWIAIGLFERLEDFAAQAIVQRVALLRPVQRDAPDARTRLVDDDVLVAHEVLPIARLFAFERGLAGDRKRCHRLQTQITPPAGARAEADMKFDPRGSEAAVLKNALGKSVSSQWLPLIHAATFASLRAPLRPACGTRRSGVGGATNLGCPAI